jgi:hypothetical protein
MCDKFCYARNQRLPFLPLCVHPAKTKSQHVCRLLILISSPQILLYSRFSLTDDFFDHTACAACNVSVINRNDFIIGSEVFNLKSVNQICREVKGSVAINEFISCSVSSP